VTRPSKALWTYHSDNIGDEYKLWSSSLCTVSRFLLLPPCNVQIISQAPYSRTSSLYVPFLMWENKFHASRKTIVSIRCINNLYVLRWETRRQSILNWMVASILRIKFDAF
jgi:hypothetical protein